MDQGRMTALKKNIALAAVTTLVMLVLAELALRVTRPHLRGSHQHPSSSIRDDFLTDDRIGRHDPLLGWRLRPNHVARNRCMEFDHEILTNSAGYRDDEVPHERTPGKKRVLLLGDSFAMGDGVERPHGFADVLETLLPNTEVINLAVSGYGTDQELLQYRQEGAQYAPDVVLLAMTIANDIENNAAPSQYGMEKTSFELIEGELRLRGTPVPERTRRGAGQSREFAAFWSPHPVHDFLDANSALYAALFESLARVKAIRKRWERDGLIYPQVGVFYTGQIGVLLHSPPPKLEGAWRLTERLLSEWAAETRRSRSRPVLLLIPTHLQVYEDLLPGVLAENGLQAGAFNPDYPNRRLMSTVLRTRA